MLHTFINYIVFYFKDHDEILEEIMKCDNSLTQLREINKNHLIELLNRCRNDYYQQIIKEKMENVNKEVYYIISIYIIIILMFNMLLLLI